MFLHSHYEIFRFTGARRPLDEKPSRLGLWVSTLLNLGDVHKQILVIMTLGGVLGL